MKLADLAARRTKAYLLDCAGYAGVAALEVGVGVVVHAAGQQGNRPLVWALSVVPPLAATVIATRAEAGATGATWGKRREHLRVTASDGTPSMSRALLRNVVKIFVPWNLGHVVAFGAAEGGFEETSALVLGATTAVYALIAAQVVLLVRGGRTLHDRVSGTRVVSDS